MSAPALPRPLVVVMLDSSRGPVYSSLDKLALKVRVHLDAYDIIDTESLKTNRVARAQIQQARELGGRLHLIGLLSDGGVHASMQHLAALIELSKAARVRVVVHAILDGVDSAPYSAPRLVGELEAMLDGGVGRIGTVSGRLYGLDCEGRWDRIHKVYQAIMADGAPRKDTALRGIQETCGIGTTEGLVEPFVVFDYPGVSLVDTAIHFNFGTDRSRELAHALGAARFERFARKGGRAPFEGRYACMTPYDQALGLPSLFARAPDPLSLPLEQANDAGRKQLHATLGSAPAIAAAAEAAIRGGRYDLVLADFANPENQERAGPLDALDTALVQLIEAAKAARGALLILGGRDADNGFPLYYIDHTDSNARVREHGSFSDLSATVCDLLGLPNSDGCEGTTLLAR